MLQNEHKIHIKTNEKSQSVQIFQSEFCGQTLPSKYMKKLSKRSNEIPHTQSTVKEDSLMFQERKQHVKSGLSIHRKYFIKGRDTSAQKNQASFSRSIFSRRVNSETKSSKSKIEEENLHNEDYKSKGKINFAQKLIEDMKKQTFKMRKSSSRYSGSKSAPKPEQKSDQKVMNREMLIKNSIKKLRPQFNVNEVKFSSSKKSLGRIRNESKGQSSSSLFKSKRVRSVNIQEKISREISKSTKRSQQNLSITLKKMNSPLSSYSEYIKSPQQKSYQIKLNFLTQYITLAQKQGVLDHIDFSSIKLLQSIYLCLVDIFSVLLTQPKPQLNKSFNYQIVKEYGGVYFQTYSKLKTEFILSQILFKTVKKKLTQYFLMQRLLFYYVVQLCSEQKISDRINEVNKIVTFLKLSEEILGLIVNMLFEDSVNKKMPQDTFIDTFKSLRLTRELDKRLPSLRESLQTMNFCQMLKRNKSFTEISQCLMQLLYNTDKQQRTDMLTIFKLQQYFNWIALSIPPLFYLPPCPSKPYTLIIDLDQTLIFYSEQTRILKYRPYMDRFLQSMQKNFQLIVFSSQPKQRSDIIVNQIQRGDSIFAYRLYKPHMVFQQGLLRKNVGYLGRNLQKIVFVDDEEKNTQWLASNSFRIKPFTGDKQDKELLHLSDWLTALISTQPTDLRGKIKQPQTSLDQIAEIDEASSTIQPSIQYMQGNQVFVHRKQN